MDEALAGTERRVQEEVRAVLEKGWHAKPENRPAMGDMVARLDSILVLLTRNPGSLTGGSAPLLTGGILGSPYQSKYASGSVGKVTHVHVHGHVEKVALPEESELQVAELQVEELQVTPSVCVLP